MALQTSVKDPFQEDIDNETVEDIQSQLDEFEKDIKQILNMIANGQQSDFFTDMLVTFTYDFQVLCVKKMFHQAGIGNKTLMFHRFAHSYGGREELLDRSYQQLSNLKGDVERLNRIYSKVRMDINEYLKDPAEMMGYQL
jgi:archaellum component FlaC